MTPTHPIYHAVTRHIGVLTRLLARSSITEASRLSRTAELKAYQAIAAKLEREEVLSMTQWQAITLVYLNQTAAPEALVENARQVLLHLTAQQGTH